MAPAVLFVCTANQCRSPMAAALARSALGQRGIDATVRSAGIRGFEGAPATDLTIAVLDEVGLDVRDHRSRALAPEDLEAADVVVTMTRDHLRTVATSIPGVFPRVFTLKELARRAREGEPRGNDTVRVWADRLGGVRNPAELLRDELADDIVDPTGEAIEAHREARGEIVAALADVIDAAWPVPND